MSFVFGLVAFIKTNLTGNYIMKVQITIVRIPIHEESTYVKPREVSITKQHHVQYLIQLRTIKRLLMAEKKKGTANSNKQKPC